MSSLIFQTPLGLMQAEIDEAGSLRRLSFAESGQQATQVSSSPIVDQLSEYFRGERRDFTVKLNLSGTPFQIQVWEELQRIPYGQTISYAELARRVGRPQAVRAVGTANGANPICVLIPCHRVIGGDGGLTGYAYGLERKRQLLELEGALKNPQKSLF